MDYLKRKIDKFLDEWLISDKKKPLIIKGARQIGKTKTIEEFAKRNNLSLVEINFVLNPEFRDIFDDGYKVDKILENISFKDPSLEFIPGKTLIFFDEIQKCINAATSLKSFKIDGRFDVICSGSLMGLSYKEIESVSTGHKIDYTMYSMDFEEFLWALGYKEEQIESLYECMKNLSPLSETQFNVLLDRFHQYMVLGGMPEVVKLFVDQKNYSGTLALQKQIILDYEEDITKYVEGLDKTKILNVFRKIPVFLGQDNKKFRISKVAHGARNREYTGVTDWLTDAGIVNISYCLNDLALPLKGNYDSDNYRMYFMDTGLLVASLDEESSKDLRDNKNFNTYKGAIYENIVGDMLKKSGYNLYFYKNEDGTQEVEFFVRDANNLIPIDVKATDGKVKSIKSFIEDKNIKDVNFGIKLAEKNIGFENNIYTFPYFLTFLLKRFLSEKK
ncbi:MAG: ATP-binding protein [Candidatus Onthovivens sp.]|nr:ATP-binding protein [Bacilli bacterium]MDY4215110.1 ATP-binding protein [Candidatus Onthovivens sp.]MDY6058071.1 ATP-binding protein [Candidatus Onthovivens sp.]